MEIIKILVTIFLGIVGLYLSHSFRRQVRQKTTDGRIHSYSELWEITQRASPTWLIEGCEVKPRRPLTEEERFSLYLEFTKWYYKGGNGMFLGDGTRSLYLAAKDNLVCPDSEFKPRTVSDGLLKLPEEQRSVKRGEMSIRQLSLLRARMRADLEVYGTLFFGKLEHEDREFLQDCGEDPDSKTWKSQRLPDITE